MRDNNTKEQNRIECTCVYVGLLGMGAINQNRNEHLALCMYAVAIPFYDERMNKTRESTMRMRMKDKNQLL